MIGGVSLFLFATMAVFAGRCATVGRPAEDDPRLVGASLFPRWIRAWWSWLCSPLVRACLRLRIPAEAVALAGVTTSLVAVVAILSGSLGPGGWAYLGAACLAGIGTRVAHLEGRPARAAALIDGALGRLAELMVLGALAYVMRGQSSALAAALCAIGATMLASDARLRSEALGAAVSTRAGWFGRSDRALLVGVACVLAPAVNELVQAGAGVDVLAAALGLVAALAAMSAIRRIQTAHEALRTIDSLSAGSRDTGRRLRVVRGGRV